VFLLGRATTVGVALFLLRGRGAVDVTPPRVTIPKNSPRCIGGVFSDGTPVWGRGTPGVVAAWHRMTQSNAESALQAG
jgi:hypothetical protein